MESRLSLKDFNFLSTIGKGTFSKIMLTEEKGFKGLFAVKIIKKTPTIENDEVSNLWVEENVPLESHTGAASLHCTFTRILPIGV